MRHFGTLEMMVLLSMAACSGGAPMQAKDTEPTHQEQKAAAAVPAASSDMPEQAKPQDAPAPAPAAVAEEIPSSKEDPGDSGSVQLGADHVKKVVAGNQPFLAEYCWTKAMKQTPNGPKKVRLATEVEVAPDGTPKSVKVVGGDAYQGLAACVEKHMRVWKYPRAKKASTLMFPIILTHGEVETRVR